MLKNTIYLKIKGRSIDKFIKRLNSHNIDMLDIKYIKYNEIIIKIYKDDLDGLNKIKTIYEVSIVDIDGIDKIKFILKENMYLFISIIISLIILYLLSNTIFSVEVIHNNADLTNIIKRELKESGIEKYHLKKTYSELQKIKKRILAKYKDKIEWLEIKNEGVKYIVRVEERIISKDNSKISTRDIVAKKDALLLRIDASSGEIVKNKYDYVHKGDIVITGELKLNEETKTRLSAKGSIYGEVWYKVAIEYPLKHDEVNLTGKYKDVFTFRIFNKYIDILNFKKYKSFKRKDKVIFKNNIFPIYFAKERQYETVEIHKTLTENKAVEEAIKKARQKINSKLSEKEYIIDIKKLKVHKNNSKIVLELFISVLEDITEYREITDEIEFR
ncbi:MAG: sporulation protein YqfD [Bacilli bacterium]|nr:sporulation protein YqfD [Bacilli bacterium]